MTFSEGTEKTLDYYKFRLETEEYKDQAKGMVKTEIKNWHEKTELFYGEEVLCHQFISVKAINKSSQGYSIQMIVAVALPGGRLQLSDIYGNFLLEFMTENYDDIVEI